MRWTQTFIPTLKEDPADAQIPSHRLMVRAGLIRQLVAGTLDLDELRFDTDRAEGVISEILEVLAEDDNPHVRCALLRTLRRIAPPKGSAPAIVVTILEEHRTSAPRCFVEAALTLNALEPQHPAVLPALVAILRKQEFKAHVRYAMVEARDASRAERPDAAQRDFHYNVVLR